MDISFLKKKSSYVRISALEDAVRGGKGHLGGTFSCIEILVFLYYGGILNIDPKDYKNPSRDYFFIGKGHACLAIYPILKDLGFIGNERYMEYGLDGSTLGGQLDLSIPGAENNTGSLGHALGLAAGVALSRKIDNKNNKSFALLGDAECEEGSIWEAILFAADNNLNNLICIIDRNRLSVTRVMETGNLFAHFDKKMEMFGWNCRMVNGHSFEELNDAFKSIGTNNKPTMIVANTVKGKGISFMEGKTKWHHSIPTDKEVSIARRELNINE
jgi:transketolase